MQMDVTRCMVFIESHRQSQKIFEKEFVGTVEFSEAGKTILAESEAECQKATELLRSYPTEQVEQIFSHMFCVILLHNTARRTRNLHASGLLKDQEAEHFLEELTDLLEKVEACTLQKHPDERPSVLEETETNKGVDEGVPEKTA